MTSSDSPRRWGAWAALGLALVFLVVVLVAGKFVYERASNQPIAISDIGSPEAKSPQCDALMAKLPEKLGKYKRQDLMDPAPAGAAAWSRTSDDQVTLRCGVQRPEQFTELSILKQDDDLKWLPVYDTTPGSDLATYYLVSQTPSVAVTAKRDVDVLDKLNDALRDPAVAVNKPVEPAAVPLSDMTANQAPACGKLAASLPQKLGDYERVDDYKAGGTMAWNAPGVEPIVLKCGVDAPKNYKAGEQVQQVNDVVWFEETKLANGLTSSVWFTVDRADFVALSMPADAGSAAISTISDAIAANLAKTGK